MLQRLAVVAPVAFGVVLATAVIAFRPHSRDAPERDPWVVADIAFVRPVLPSTGRTHPPLLRRTAAKAGEIAGHVVDLAGHRVEGASVVINTVRDTHREPSVVMTDAAGDFRITDLPDGLYMLVVYWGNDRLSYSDIVVRAGYVSENDLVVSD